MVMSERVSRLAVTIYPHSKADGIRSSSMMGEGRYSILKTVCIYSFKSIGFDAWNRTKRGLILISEDNRFIEFIMLCSL